MSYKTRNILSLTFNAFIAISGIACFVIQLIKGLPFYDKEAFRYYTNLSNIFLSLSCFVYLIFNIKIFKNNEIRTNKFATLTKLYAVITTTITFVVVIGFLGPVISYKIMFGTLPLIMFHAINPLLGLFSFLLIDNNSKIKFKHALYAIIPTLVYGIFYITYMNVTGIDFYQFLSKGMGVGIIVMGLIVISSFLQAILYRFIINKRIDKFIYN